MKSLTAFLTVIVCGAVCSAVYADYGISDEGTWPKSWPAELEPLRKQARSLEGSLVLLLHYEIPFSKQAEFESAWPQLLKVKSKEAPIILLRGPNTWLGVKTTAGVRIHAHPAGQENTEAPINPNRVRERGVQTTYIELIVDGEIVDLNRIPLPADTPIIDERFKEEPKKSVEQPKK